MADTGAGAGRAFIGSFTSAGGRGIVTAAVDPATGALTETGVTDAVADPSYLAAVATPAGPVLYAVSETEDGGVAAFDATGAAPRPIGRRMSVGGSGPTHISVSQGHLLTANYGSGSVSVVPVGTDGAPGPVGGVMRHEGDGPVRDRQAEPHAHQVLPDPTGRWVLSVDLGTDSVRICALDTAADALTPHHETALRPGTGPRQLAFHPDGRHVYVLGELKPEVTVCRWDVAAGLLEPVAETAVVPEGTTGPAYPSALVVSPDGRHLWAAVRGHDSIAVLSLDGTGERAALVANVPCGGHWPRDLALDPTGRRLYAANERSGDVTWFALDPETGIPGPVGSFPVPAASCVVFA
ncbi:lactonase family protein [Streptomyces sp. NPDC003023]|uniref:lactonase family protein n=1 Tax=Streptomyces sp. NPDC003023 TaxID=3364675 RepID=UPI0036A8CC82